MTPTQLRRIRTRLLAQGLAIADAEGISELPVIGRLLGREDHHPAESGG
jgi:hypothetical protein